MEDFKNSIERRIKLKDTLSRELTDLPGEIWEDIPKYEERYQISNYSRVKSIIHRKHFIIKKTISNGRFKVTLFDKRGRRKHFQAGRLSATVFLRPPEENEVLRYLDNNTLFDASFNLAWGSKKESSQLAFKLGRFPPNHGRGQRNGMYNKHRKIK